MVVRLLLFYATGSSVARWSNLCRATVGYRCRAVGGANSGPLLGRQTIKIGPTLGHSLHYWRSDGGPTALCLCQRAVSGPLVKPLKAHRRLLM